MPITIILLCIFATTVIAGFVFDFIGTFFAIRAKNNEKKELCKLFFMIMTVGEWLVKFSFSLGYFILIVAIVEFCFRFIVI